MTGRPGEAAALTTNTAYPATSCGWPGRADQARQHAEHAEHAEYAEHAEHALATYEAAP